MKKLELQQIIREEISKVLNENLEGTLSKWKGKWIVSYTTPEGDFKGDQGLELDPSQVKDILKYSDSIEKNRGMDVEFIIVNGKAKLIQL
jgi:hypothetical protein